jgi:hypothetical protein
MLSGSETEPGSQFDPMPSFNSENDEKTQQQYIDATKALDQDPDFREGGVCYDGVDLYFEQFETEEEGFISKPGLLWIFSD